MRLQSLISFVLTILNTLIIIMKLLFGIIIDKYYYEDIFNAFINLDTKDIYLQFIDENTQIRNRTKQTQNNLFNIKNLDKSNKKAVVNISENKNLDEKNLG